MKRRRIVLDTNVVVSAAIKPGGPEEFIVELVAAHELALYASTAVIAEYETVFARPKFAHIDPTRIARLLELLKDEAVLVIPRELVTESRDEPDNRFLECAETAGAEYLITGNKRDFPERWKSTRVMNARELLRLIEDEASGK
jgi:putative PIN family toxin of toxin-antitoxin system